MLPDTSTCPTHRYCDGDGFTCRTTEERASAHRRVKRFLAISAFVLFAIVWTGSAICIDADHHQLGLSFFGGLSIALLALIVFLLIVSKHRTNCTCPACVATIESDVKGGRNA